MLETNTFGTGKNAFCASDKHFSAGNERVENARSNFTHTHTASYIVPATFKQTYLIAGNFRMGLIFVHEPNDKN